MCCWPFTDVTLEDAPPAKKEEEEKAEYVLVSDQLALHPGVIAPIQPVYQACPHLYYAASPAPEPIKHNFWYGNTKAEIDAKAAAAAAAAAPVQLIPQVPAASQQYYCRELDGSYTLRSTNEIMEKLQPGHWTFASPGGYPYWVRTKAS